MAKLTIFRDEVFDREVVLSPGTTKIGRADQNDVVLADQEKLVSRFHAEIRFVAGTYSIVDLQSANGVVVSGRKTAEARLTPGLAVKIGRYRLQFEDDERPAEEAPGPCDEGERTVIIPVIAPDVKPLLATQVVPIARPATPAAEPRVEAPDDSPTRREREQAQAQDEKTPPGAEVRASAPEVEARGEPPSGPAAAPAGAASPQPPASPALAATASDPDRTPAAGTKVAAVKKATTVVPRRRPASRFLGVAATLLLLAAGGGSVYWLLGTRTSEEPPAVAVIETGGRAVAPAAVPTSQPAQALPVADAPQPAAVVRDSKAATDRANTAPASPRAASPASARTAATSTVPSRPAPAAATPAPAAPATKAPSPQLQTPRPTAAAQPATNRAPAADPAPPARADRRRSTDPAVAAARPRSLPAMLESARGSLIKGDYLAAVKGLEAILEADPKYPEAADLLGIARGGARNAAQIALNTADRHEMSGDYLAALEQYDRALQLEPGNQQAADGVKRVKARRTADGEESLRKARQLDGQGRKDEAIAAYERALTLLPADHADVAAIRQRLAALKGGGA